MKLILEGGRSPTRGFGVSVRTVCKILIAQKRSDSEPRNSPPARGRLEVDPALPEQGWAFSRCLTSSSSSAVMCTGKSRISDGVQGVLGGWICGFQAALLSVITYAVLLCKRIGQIK